MSNIAHFTLYSVANLRVSDISDMSNIAHFTLYISYLWHLRDEQHCLTLLCIFHISNFSNMSNIAHFTLYSVANLHVSNISDMSNIAQ